MIELQIKQVQIREKFIWKIYEKLSDQLISLCLKE
ncbi:unnamed protein product [Paramecium octaurelia]|uniref:Uncharacterized protein n=1 Tax=Paramecium octaurelia TaxID=43137 RepID=A0A8S1TSQ6_PAROT|nr:unnamed protein product [Paramecium octaurelia]